MVVKWMPVSANKETGGTSKPENNESPIKTVMRSKGFMWLSSGHATAFYWSHAGMHFEIRCVSALRMLLLPVVEHTACTPDWQERDEWSFLLDSNRLCTAHDKILGPLGPTR
jgi:hypothetical protein